MKAISSRNLLIGMAMLAAAGLALALTPRLRMADEARPINLEAMVPGQIGEWTQQDFSPQIINPELESQVNKIYSQTLDRYYVNGKGERIMLSIAYGGDQRVSMQVHRPEVCYASAGFQVGSISKDVIDLRGTKLPVMKLIATRDSRIEPITYWVMIGNSAVQGRMEQNFARWKYGLTGEIPYGMVIRVSSISVNESESHRAQEEFVRDMLDAMSEEDRRILTGAVL